MSQKFDNTKLTVIPKTFYQMTERERLKGGGGEEEQE